MFSIRVPIIALAAATLLMLASPAADALPTIEFFQLDFELDGQPVLPDTEWGMVRFTYQGESLFHYLNLTVNVTGSNSWQIQNIPLQSREGAGVTHVDHFTFDLGVPRGTDVTSLDFGFLFTPLPSPVAPAIAAVGAPVLDELIRGFADHITEALLPLPPAAALIGGEAADNVKRGHKGFPNQECGPLECVPAAVSNSLQFLKEKKGLKIADADTTIAKMKEVLPFTAGEGTDSTWPEAKEKFIKDNKLNLVQKKIVGNDNVKTIADEIKNGEDVEIRRPGHVAAVVEVTPLKDGRTQLVVAHDTDHGAPGGTKTEVTIFDPTTGKFTGATWFDGTFFAFAVSESVTSVPEPSVLFLMLPGLGAVVIFRRRRGR